MTRLSSAGKIAVSRSSAEDRAQSVLFKAADLFYRQGYDATSMNDIAQAVELTKAGLYYYTKGKEDLLYKIMDFAMDCVERDIVEPAEEISDPTERLRFVVENHLKKIFDMGAAITVLTVEVTKLQPKLEKRVALRQRAYLDLVVSTIRELKRAKKLKPLDERLAALNVFSCILGVTRWYKPNGRFKKNRIIAETLRFIESGLIAE